MSYSHEGPPEVVLDFREALEDLQRNDQYQIENLTMIAKEATEFAQAISQEVESHIRKTRPEYKLPALYLLDSLVKHIGTPYTVYLSRNLYRTFFDSYTVVDNNTRRAMDELFRSWMQPVPESRDPRPVFPADVTQPIDAALSKMRGVDQKSKEAAEASRMQKMHALPARVGQIHQPGRTPTPNGQYAYQPPPPHGQTPPQGFSGLPNMPFQGQPPPPFPPAIRSPAPSLPSPVRQGVMSVNQPYPPPPQQGGTPVQYVYSGPPPPTMSHQARLDKLRMDVQGLTELAKAHLARYPYDAEKQKLLPNLESLKRLLDTGTLSLTHIQSTEVVIANIARDFSKPPPTPPPSQGPPPPALGALPFDPSKIAAILAKSTPQPTPPQPPAPQSYAPPLPVVSTPQFSQAFPAASAPPPPSGIPPVSMAQIMSLLKSSATPSSSNHTPTPSAAPPAGSIMDQLRASGLLGVGTPSHNTPTHAPTPAAASILSQLMQPQPGAQAMNDVRLDAASLKIKRPYLIRQLYQDKPDQCRQCGMRFPLTEQGKKAKGVHLDWHFKVNTRVQDSMKNAINRSWYIDERDWIGYREELDGYSGMVTEGTPGKSSSAKKTPKEQFVFVPTDARLVNLPCSICQEKFEQGWDEETQQPIWKDAVKVGNKYYHATCWTEVTKGHAASAMGGVQAASTADYSARSTPDPVLGKRKLDDYNLDATS